MQTDTRGVPLRTTSKRLLVLLTAIAISTVHCGIIHCMDGDYANIGRNRAE